MEFDEFNLPQWKTYADIYYPIQLDNPLFLAFWALLYGGVLFLLQRLIIRRERVKIQFFITDMWAAILALTPSFFLLVDIKDEDQSIKWNQVILFALTLVSTLCGIRAWLILAIPRAGQPMPGRASHFVSVLGGGLLGLIGIFFTGFAYELLPVIFVLAKSLPRLMFDLFCIWIKLCLLMPPLIGVSFVCFRIQKKFYDLWVN